MRTIGQIIKDARTKKRLSLGGLEKRTKIKKEFIGALEQGEWEKLPEFPVVTGFVKNIASVLRLNKKQLVALLRRDYPPKKLLINPKPDVFSKFVWSPKLTFLLGIFAVFLGIGLYLSFQYKDFISPPILQVNSPRNNQVLDSEMLYISGTTDPEATIIVNNQPAIVDEYGNFAVEIEIFEGTKEVKIKATSRSGKVAEVVRNIEVRPR